MNKTKFGIAVIKFKVDVANTPIYFVKEFKILYRVSYIDWDMSGEIFM
jgi:hypothetical protein